MLIHNLGFFVTNYCFTPGCSSQSSARSAFRILTVLVITA